MSKVTKTNVHRSIGGLREALFETLDGLRAGRIDANKAKAVVGVSQTILNTVQTQLQMERSNGAGARKLLSGPR